jgi:hypothetical protein
MDVETELTVYDNKAYEALNILDDGTKLIDNKKLFKFVRTEQDQKENEPITIFEDQHEAADFQMQNHNRNMKNLKEIIILS